MKINILITCLLFALHSMYSQETIPASGGESIGSGGSSSYTVGQALYTTNGSIAQGVQQAYEFQTLSNLELTTVSLIAMTYPNPTSDYIILKISDKALKNLKYTLFNLNGKSVANGLIKSESTQIKMQHAVTGIYLLKITQKQQTLKSFKIIKR